MPALASLHLRPSNAIPLPRLPPQYYGPSKPSEIGTDANASKTGLLAACILGFIMVAGWLCFSFLVLLGCAPFACLLFNGLIRLLLTSRVKSLVGFAAGMVNPHMHASKAVHTVRVHGGMPYQLRRWLLHEDDARSPWHVMSTARQPIQVTETRPLKYKCCKITVRRRRLCGGGIYSLWGIMVGTCLHTALFQLLAGLVLNSASDKARRLPLPCDCTSPA